MSVQEAVRAVTLAPMARANFEIRDPFILQVDGTYCCYYSKSWFGGREVKLRTSRDLENWSEEQIVMEADPSWCVAAVWAPEVHKYNGRYYLFVTLHCNDGKHRNVGTWVFAADRKEGPFKPVKDDALTPEGQCIDGTLWIENGTPYMVYTYGSPDTDCSMMYAPMKDDLSGFAGEPVRLFGWRDLKGHFEHEGVAEGPSLYRSKSGKLFMTWSNISCWGYCVALAVSDSGKVTGPWRQLGIPIRIDGGHGSFFTKVDGSPEFTLHTANSSKTNERMVFAAVEDNGDTLGFQLESPITDNWSGGRRTIFDFHGLTAWLIAPDHPRAGNPWTWTMHFNGAFYDRTGAQDMLKDGFFHAALDVIELDDASAQRELASFHEYLVKNYGLAPKANLIGIDRGAVLAREYAKANPSKVHALYLDDGTTAEFIRGSVMNSVVLGKRTWPGLDEKDMPLLKHAFEAE